MKNRVRIAVAQPGQVIAAEQTKGFRRGKSELRRAGCRITSGEGNLRESAIEKETATQVVRVERCGKSAPAVRRLAGLVNPIRSKTE